MPQTTDGAFEVVDVKASTVRLSDVLLTDSMGGSPTPQTEDADHSLEV